ncbi:hypothetical protein KYK29_15190 [Shinella daejeonensis]|uniref:hypothetical protein n=1 Tax=Shinella daejeonensis TaxID=659017 RepID=UPI0020C77A2A|nr:hypothetical protein [Shinella daejeonensis]MCP8896274.1 hypothetical protein [Shinella daejeonensis]
MRILSLSLVMLILAATDPAAAGGEGRYRMEKTGDGILRLDTATGEMSLCRERDGQIACRMAADERAAFEAELERLTDRVEALEKAVAASADAKARLPTDEEIDRTMSIMEKMMRTFMGIVKGLEGGGDDTPSSEDAVPQKT